MIFKQLTGIILIKFKVTYKYFLSKNTPFDSFRLLIILLCLEDRGNLMKKIVFKITPNLNIQMAG